jgi:hypothetical protein
MTDKIPKREIIGFFARNQGFFISLLKMAIRFIPHHNLVTLRALRLLGAISGKIKESLTAEFFAESSRVKDS